MPTDLPPPPLHIQTWTIATKTDEEFHTLLNSCIDTFYTSYQTDISTDPGFKYPSLPCSTGHFRLGKLVAKAGAPDPDPEPEETVTFHVLLLVQPSSTDADADTEMAEFRRCLALLFSSSYLGVPSQELVLDSKSNTQTHTPNSITSHWQDTPEQKWAYILGASWYGEQSYSAIFEVLGLTDSESGFREALASPPAEAELFVSAVRSLLDGQVEPVTEDWMMVMVRKVAVRAMLGGRNEESLCGLKSEGSLYDMLEWLSSSEEEEEGGFGGYESGGSEV